MENSHKISKYLKKVQLKRDLESFSASTFSRKYKLAVVIPIYGEYNLIGKTLKSLSLNGIDCLNKTLVVLVINNPETDSKAQYFKENQQLLKELGDNTFQSKCNLVSLNLMWIDASSIGFELPKRGGAGMARKLGMDSSLAYLEWDNDPIIISLDADTQVQENYLETINNFFGKHKAITGASINYKHLPGSSPEEKKAIRDYEYSIDYYVEKLREAGSPYAYHTIGSACACRADAYIKAGGMKTHRGGEDFYFMQSLRKLGEVLEIKDTTVFQSARISDRVPFGTGPKMQQTLSGKEIKLYNPKTFEVLKDTLQKAAKWINSSEVAQTKSFLEKLNADAKNYFISLKFESLWPGILVNNVKNHNTPTTKDKDKLTWAFHVWFDAFKTLKFIHYLERTFPSKYPKIELPEKRASGRHGLLTSSNQDIKSSHKVP